MSKTLSQKRDQFETFQEGSSDELVFSLFWPSRVLGPDIGERETSNELVVAGLSLERETREARNGA